MKKIKVGSRESKLAVAQSQILINDLKEKQNLDIELITLKTTGDIILDKTLDKIGGKGLFVKELDKSLLEDKTDISIHSLKDVPMELNPELPLIAYFKRENPLDVLILPKGINSLDKTKPIGTSSKRRIYQLKKIYPDYNFKPIRGNVISRLEKLDNGEYSGLVLAYAGIKRLNLEERISKIFTPEEIVPACGQGILVVQGKKGKNYSYLECINNKNSEYEAKCERAFVSEFNGGCSSPIAAFAQVIDNKIILTGFYSDDEGNYSLKDTVKGEIFEAVELGKNLAKKFKEAING